MTRYKTCTSNLTRAPGFQPDQTIRSGGVIETSALTKTAHLTGGRGTAA